MPLLEGHTLQQKLKFNFSDCGGVCLVEILTFKSFEVKTMTGGHLAPLTWPKV